MKIPAFRIKLPVSLPKRNKKLEATARRLPREGGAEIMDEPNMKLSSAFIVVLALHVVAVGGIYAFNSIKAHRAPALDPHYQPKPAPAVAKADAAPPSENAPALTTAAHTASIGANTRTHRVKPGETIARIAADHRVTVDDLEEANGLKNVNAVRVGQELKIPTVPSEPARPLEKKAAGSPAKLSSMVRDSGDTYTVAKGDNPMAIARKFGVGYDDLLKLNKIEDAKKLKIGTKLRLPAKARSKS